MLMSFLGLLCDNCRQFLIDQVAWGWVPCQMAWHRTSSEGMVYWRLMGGGGAQHDKPSLVVIVRSGPNNLDSLSCNCGNHPLHFSIDDFNFYHISDTSTMFSGFWIVSVLFFLRHFPLPDCITIPLISMSDAVDQKKKKNSIMLRMMWFVETQSNCVWGDFIHVD